MVKKYALSKKDCEVSLTAFYENAAKAAGYSVTEKTHFDCRKICVTAIVVKALWVYYLASGMTDEQIATLMIQYGPKANVAGMNYEVEIEDGFATEAV